MRNIYIAVIVSALLVIISSFSISRISEANKNKTLKVGIVYVSDESTAYTNNFIKAVNEAEHTYGDRIEWVPKYNVPEGKEKPAFQELVDEGCGLIFSTSFGYYATAKEFAQNYPDIQICHAAGFNANDDPVLPNYHTFMGEIYEGRYLSGVAAGMKLRELIDEGTLTPEQAKVGYIAAFPNAEVISGYTAFYLGVRSEVPEAVMSVVYINSWSSYALEKKAAVDLIKQGCVIISQHSDTSGPAVACENTDKSTVVYHISYNQSMTDVAPTTSITGCRINWEPYFIAAAGAVLDNKDIEKCVSGHVHGNDVGAGFKQGWVEMLPINEIIAADGTAEKLDELIKRFNSGSITVFKGDLTGTDPTDPSDVIDLSEGFIENENSSCPSFHYILDDVITVLEEQQE